MEKNENKNAKVPGERYLEVRDSLKNMRGKLLDLADKVKEEVLALSKVGRIKLDIISLKKQQDALLKSLGENTYDLIKRGVISLPELTGISAKLDEFSSKVSSLEREVEEMARKSYALRDAKKEELRKSRLKVNKMRKKHLIRKGGTKEEEEE